MGLLRLKQTLLASLLALAVGCVAGGDVADDGSESGGGKEDSPFAEEGGPCATSFDCEIGLECLAGGCAPREDVCEGAE